MNIQSIISNSLTAIFLLIVISYYYLLIKRVKRKESKEKFSSISIIIPAHNEEKYVVDCLKSVIKADFDGKKEIIVIDDGSKDKTYLVASNYIKKYCKGIDIKLLKNKHSGKADTVNKGLKIAKSELIATVDADSIIAKDSLVEAVKLFYSKKVAVVCSIVKVKNRKSIIGMWLHIEQLYNSLLRSLFAKINVNIVAPGPLSLYRKKQLESIGGFSNKGYSEDVDVALRFIKIGYRIECAEKCISETNMPVDIKGFFRQRRRFARGWINIFKRHLRLNHTFVQIYTLPLAFFGYLQAIVFSFLTIYNLAVGYTTYFTSKGVYMSWQVVKFVLEWFSILGIINWFSRVLMGIDPLTIVTAIGIAASLLVYPLYVWSIIKYDKNISLWHIFPLVLMFPFWLVIMVIYLINLPEIFIKNQRNIWTK